MNEEKLKNALLLIADILEYQKQKAKDLETRVRKLEIRKEGHDL